MPTVIRAPGASLAARSCDFGNFWKPNPRWKVPTPTPPPMGSYMSTPRPAQPPLTQVCPKPRPRAASREDCGSRVGTGPLHRVPQNWDPANPRRVVPEAWRRFPAKAPPETVLGPDLSSAWENYMKRCLWSARHPRQVLSPVTIKIAPPEPKTSPWASRAQGPGACFAGRPPSREHPDPCAKEKVLRALSQCQKGNRSVYKDTDLQPDVQPLLSAGHPTAGTASAQDMEQQLQSWGKRPTAGASRLPPVPKSSDWGVSFATDVAQPSGSFDS
ncbi:POM121-like protein 12 [Suricata suricatta]|uniref:POM121-like protein 12 n=1 Tax=Suricata suricatta TaxID=37032 RepID=UPI001155BB8D|nr:POM121-like protein 12 [Suricata suricatta]